MIRVVNYYQLEQRIQRAIQAQRYVGMAVAIIQGAEVTYARGFGVASVEDASPQVTPDTLFCIGSISKTLTATLVMRLVEQGRLDLDTPIVNYLPGFQFSDPALGARITLRHVLSHTTGLPAGGKDFGPRDPDALRRFVWDELPMYAFIAPPGRLHLYNNTVLVIAGHVAEAVTGRFYEELMQELVFDPLGMQRTTFDRLVAMTYPLALAHRVGADGVLRTKHRFTDNVSGNPAGFGISSTLDLAHFAIMHLSRGQFAGAQFLAPESVAEMQLPHANRSTFGVESHYGMGWYTGSYKGVRQVLHGGMLESYNCFLTLFPDQGVGVVLQSNYDDGTEIGDLVEQIYDGLLGLREAHASPRPVAPDRAAWERHVGTYLSTSRGLATIRAEGDELMLEQNDTSMALVAVEGDLYQAEHTPVRFLPEPAGPTEYMVIDSMPYWRLEPDPSFVPDPQRWERYAGVYYAWQIDPDPPHVRVHDRQLLVRWGGNEVIYTALSNTRFVGAYGLLEFEGAETEMPVLVSDMANRLYRRP
ncbi:MAG: beta-lactamase family protein [Chloroflexales bacterium]|nr:beta-lactamase family protein [Chloroflexales bacterium]